MHSKKITIAVVIPTYNRRAYLKKLLLQLNKQNGEDFSLKVIVVVDGSTDGTFEMLEKDFPEAHMVKGTGNWWFTKSLNEGCHVAKKLGVDYILTLNDDCYFDQNLVKNLLKGKNKLPNLSAIGAITLIKSKKYRVTFSGTKKFIKWRAKFVPYLDNRKEYDIEQLSGIYPTFTLMTRGLLFPIYIGEKIDFFDDKNFPQYGSDDDFVLRILKQGFSSFVSWDVKIFDNPKLSSVGSSITRPTFSEFSRSFFNKYSANSLKKTWKFQLQHGYKILLPIAVLYFIISTFYAYVWKYRKTNL